jgi:phage terminase large subunit
MTQERSTLFEIYTDVYYWLKESDKFITVMQGGTSSGKTIAILQRICHIAIEDPGCTIHVVAQDFPNLRDGALADFKNLISSSDLLSYALVNPNLLRGPYLFKNGTKLVFVSYKTEYKARSGKRDYLFINECQGVSWPIALNLVDRTKKKVFLDYNPSAKFWVHHEILGNAQNSLRAKLIISNSSHNTALPESIKQTVANMKHEYLRTGTTSARNRWKVMGLGLTGVAEGAVFTHIQYTHFFPLNAKGVIYGLDFGFTNNNTALVKIGVFNNAIYGKEILYEQRLYRCNP